MGREADATNQTPAPGQAAARGSLDGRPLPRLLHQLLRKRVTGRLCLTDETGDASVVFLRDGCPVHVERPNDLDRLQRILLERGVLDAARAEALAAEAAATGRRLGDLLVERGVLTARGLADLLKLQLRRKLVRLFFSRRGTFEVFLGDHPFGLGPEFATMRVDPRTILYPGIRTTYDEARLRDELAPLAARRFRLVALSPGHLEAMGFASDDSLTAALRASALTLDDLPLLGPKIQEARAALLALYHADLLELTEAVAASGPTMRAPTLPTLSGEATPAPPLPRRMTNPNGMAVADPGAAAAPIAAAGGARAPTASAGGTRAPTGGGAAPGGGAELRGTLEALAARLDELSHFELLGVSPTATAGEVNAAYLRHLRQLHPDRMASLGLRDLVAVAERVVARIGEAHAVLLDPQRRAEYEARRAGKPAPVDDARAILAAELAFQRGELLQQRGDHAGAAAAFTEALAGNPQDPTYKAHLAWARYEGAGAQRAALLRETQAAVEAAVAERPRFARGHYWLGVLHKERGQGDAAERAFRAAVAADASFLDAQREIRLLELRRSRGGDTAPPARSAGSGLFDKVFKR
jgi:curved DNA-binding protein CbpA